MFVWLAPLLAAAAPAAGQEQAVDPLATAIFEVCPALLHGELSKDDNAKLAQRGFKYSLTTDQHAYIMPLNENDIFIVVENIQNNANPARSCPIIFQGQSPQVRRDRLLTVLRTKNIIIKILPSPVGGEVINANNPTSGKLVATTQVFDNHLLTLVTGL